MKSARIDQMSISRLMYRVLIMWPKSLNSPLFGGIAGATLELPDFELADGITMRRTYAHLMSPYILAFKQPESGRPHPGPWKAVKGGRFLDVEIEIEVNADIQIGNFDRLNSLWWCIAILRLSSNAAIRMPVISDMSFGVAETSATEPNFLPIETYSSEIRRSVEMETVISQDSLMRARKLIQLGLELIETPHFNRAFQVFDAAIWAHTPGSALISIWAAIETLLRPGPNDITKRLSAMVAALLTPPGANRDRTYQQVASLYRARGGSAHASEIPETEQLFASFELGRRCFEACILNQSMPDNDKLMNGWKHGR